MYVSKRPPNRVRIWTEQLPGHRLRRCWRAGLLHAAAMSVLGVDAGTDREGDATCQLDAVVFVNVELLGNPILWQVVGSPAGEALELLRIASSMGMVGRLCS